MQKKRVITLDVISDVIVIVVPLCRDITYPVLELYLREMHTRSDGERRRTLSSDESL